MGHLPKENDRRRVATYRVVAHKHFKPLIQGRHVLVRTDNCTTMTYFTRKSRVRSTALLRLAENLLLWASEHFLSLKALQVPGLENRGADLTHPLVVEQICA